MSTIPTAAFDFLDFKVKKYSFNDIESNDNELSLRIKPSGVFDLNTEIFKMTLVFDAFLEGEELISSIFEFRFQIEKIQDNHIPSFFYKNSIGIAFPYVRAFISTLTLQSGNMPLILPLLNLGGLEQEYINNTIVIEKKD